MVTTAARISSRVLSSEAWKASAAPWKLLRMPRGRPSSASAARIALTASPSATSGARLKDRVTAGNCPRWLMASIVRRSLMRATDESGTLPPPAAGMWMCSSEAGLCWKSGPTSSTTRYRADWVKMFDTWR